MIGDGSNEVMKSVIGREMLGKDVYDSMYGRSESIDPLRRVREKINYSGLHKLSRRLKMGVPANRINELWHRHCQNPCSLR